MPIPTIRSPGLTSGKHWCASDNGKGDGARNISDTFKENFEKIKWGPRGKKPKNGHTRIVYK